MALELATLSVIHLFTSWPRALPKKDIWLEIENGETEELLKREMAKLLHISVVICKHKEPFFCHGFIELSYAMISLHSNIITHPNLNPAE